MAAELLQSVADGGIEDRVADPQDDPTDDVRVHACRQRDVAPRALPNRLDQAGGGLLVERDRARDLHRERLVLLLPQPPVFVTDAEENRHAMVFDQQGEEVQQDLIGVHQQRGQRALLLFDAEVGREEEHRQLAVGSQGVGELAQLLADLLQLAMLTGHLEQRAAIYAGELLHQFCDASADRLEKSSSSSACSTSLRWSASSSVLRVTFSVAITVKSATSLRMSSSARWVAAWISRSARLVASATSSWPCSLASCSWTSAAWRARWTISSDWLRASFRRSRYSSSTLSACWRVCSAASMSPSIFFARWSSASPIRGNTVLRRM